MLEGYDKEGRLIKLSKKAINVAMTPDEMDFIKKLSEASNKAEASNIFRRGILCYAASLGIEVPEGLFVERKSGNRLTKKGNRQPKRVSPLAA